MVKLLQFTTVSILQSELRCFSHAQCRVHVCIQTKFSEKTREVTWVSLARNSLYCKTPHSTFMGFLYVQMCVSLCLYGVFLYCFFGSFSYVCFVLFQFLKILLYCIVFWINFLVVLSEVVFCCPILALHLHLYDPVWCLKLGMRVAGVKEAEHQERSSPWKPLLRV